MNARPLILALFVGALGAQDARLPSVPRLGAMPNAPRVHVTANGVRGVEALPAGGTEVVLWCNAAAPCGAIATAIEKVAANGARIVYFAATQPDRREGALGLALPLATYHDTTLTLRAHRDRPGVPVRSVVPLLRRMRAGWEHEAGRAFVLAIDVPASATSQQLLSLLAAVTESGVQSASLHVRGAESEPRDGELALDLDGVVQAWIVANDPPREPGAAAPAQYGLLRAPQPQPALEPRQFGGWACGAAPPEHRIAWLVDSQQPDGSVGENGVADPEATGLAALAHLGEGNTLDAGTWHAPVRRCVGWLLAQQRVDGSFEAPTAGSLQRHALITCALAEAAGSSENGALLRDSVAAAVRWLAENRRKEGGWGASCGAPANAIATAWAFLAIYAASNHSLCETANPNDVVSWFDRFADDSPASAGAELLCRYLADQDPKTTPRLERLMGIALETDMSDPQATFWASYASFRMGAKRGHSGPSG